MKKIKYRNIDDKGALEGLPLYMIILVVIAGVGTAVIGGWMMSAQTTELGSIEVDIHNQDNKKLDLSKDWDQKTIYVNAYDQNSDSLEGVTISLEGCGAGDIDEPVKKTDSEGKVSFTLEKSDIHVPSGSSYGEIEITAKHTGDMTLTESDTIIVTE